MTPNAILRRRQSSTAMQSPLRVGLVGSYVPNKCGIATFGRDLIEAMQAEDSRVRPYIVAVQGPEETWGYPQEVNAVVRSNKPADYRRAARQLQANADYILLQHEFGIFGGTDVDVEIEGRIQSAPLGENILALLDSVDLPVITTFHTVLAHPDPARRKLTKRIADRSIMNVTMTETARRNLISAYGVNPAKISTIPHGVPGFDDISIASAKQRLDIPVDRQLLMVTGLIGPNKGIEDIIAVLPEVLAVHPQAYLYIIGETHPNIVQAVGEVYRDELVALAARLGVTEHIVFINSYLPTDELAQYIQATDLYLTIHRDPAQAASGTLAYAVGAGRVAIATPYQYAQEILAGGRGLLVPLGDTKVLAQTITGILSDPERFADIQQRARRLGRTMSWSNVAGKYLALTSSHTRAS
jgi:glycosyltransferase involved in cell wall biosynthesis